MCLKTSFIFNSMMLTEGLAVGVGFGAIGKSPSATFESARYVFIPLVHSCKAVSSYVVFQ